MSALQIENLTCSYQDTAVFEDLNLTLQENEIVCLLGESGCGKTTLLKAVAGLQKQLTGCIRIRNRVLNDAHHEIAAEERQVGLIFQDYALFPHLNVFDNVAFSLQKLSYQEQAQRVLEMLSLVKLQDFVERFPHQLSGGQQQRVAIARALAYRPDLMLLDEPFSNLDQHVRFELINEIRQLFKQRQVSALFVTHSKEEGYAFADRIALMQAGKIVQIDTPQLLYQSPNSAYVADFMGKSNYVDVTVIDEYNYQSCFGVLSTSLPIQAEKGSVKRLLLRPEHLYVEADVHGSALIKQITFQGGTQQLVVEFAGHEFTVQSCHQEMAKFNLGQVVSIELLEHNYVTFDSE